MKEYIVTLYRLKSHQPISQVLICSFLEVLKAISMLFDMVM